VLVVLALLVKVMLEVLHHIARAAHILELVVVVAVVL
jgi:hypothetical protein